MTRSMPNLLEEITYYQDKPAADQARYGADLLGRAIGHEAGLTVLGTARSLGDFGPIIYASGFTASPLIMLFRSARDVQAQLAAEVTRGR